MGIRVHRILGYGLDDIEHDKYWPNDPRIDREKLESLWNIKTEDYLEWLDEKYGDDGSLSKFWSLDQFITRHYDEEQRKQFRFYDCFAYQGEYGLPNVLVLKPLSMKEWSRFDDAIDYMQETYLYATDEDSQVNRLQRFGMHGMYPWNGLYMDKRTGQKVKDSIRWVQIHWSPPADEIREIVAKSLGFANGEEADENLVPVVPEEVRDIAEYSGIFTSDDVWLQLRPMLYTYWA